jgi:hypothetical protein
VVSNNHFDQDGLMSMYALVDPEGARARRERMIDVARVGDFGTYRDRDSARIAWAIATIGNAMDEATDPYAELVERVPELLDHPERFRREWAYEDAHLQMSEDAIASGTARIEELEAIDLAVVTVPEHWHDQQVHRFTLSIPQAMHPTAVNNATDRFRLLIVRGRHYEVQYRYETWVQYVSRRPLGRVDLTPLATALSELEPGDARWAFDGVGAIGPSLHLVGAGTDAPSAIPPEQFREHVIRTLTTGASAWDPYD